MLEGDDGPGRKSTVPARTRRRQVALAAVLVFAGAVVGFSARCAISALLVNVGNLAVLRGADDLAASAFDAATTVDPATHAASNFRISQALLSGDYDAAADELVELRALGGSPRGVAATSSVLLHLDAILARRAGDPERALALMREAVARAGVNAHREALRLLDQLSREAADRPYGPSPANVVLTADPRRNSCGDEGRLARVRLSRNEVAVGGPLRVEMEWTSIAGEPASRDIRVLRNLVPNGAFTWGATGASLPLGYTAHPQLPAEEAAPSGDVYLGFADLDGQPVSALVLDNLDGPARTSRIRGDWISATPGACYLFASEVWVDGGQPHFGLYLRAPGRADTAVFGLQGGLPDGWWRQARLLRLPPDIEAIQVFFWNYRSSGAVAFTLAVVTRIDS